MVWIAAAVTWPALLLGLVWPGWGAIPDGTPPSRELIESLAHPAPSRASPVPGSVVFNDPTGPAARQYALVRHLNAAIDGTEPGSVIRIVAYSFAMPSVSQRLVAAHQRDVVVQVVVDDHSGRWASVRRLERVLGTDTDRASFVKVCHASCRGRRGNQHAKFALFSGTRDDRDVLMVGSLNLTNFAAKQQWNDLYTVPDNASLYAEYVEIFDLLVRDTAQRRLRLPVADEGYKTEVSPLPGYATGNDPLVERLDAVRCHGATDGAGTGGHTLVRVSMHAWNGSRGLVLARHVAALHEAGCDVRVLYGVGIGGQVKSELASARVPMRDSRRSGRRTHEKLMILSGHFGQDTAANYVWTGSHNWSNRSLLNDEVTLRIPGGRVVKEYLANFDKIWARSLG